MSSVIRHEMTSQPEPSKSSPPTSSAVPSDPPRGVARLWHGLRAAAPTLAVIAALTGLGAWGYGSDWTLPKFSALVGRDSAHAEIWCEEHNVPESMCIECNAQLLPVGKDYGWCREHGVANCPLEHPEVAQLKAVPSITSGGFGAGQPGPGVASPCGEQ